MNKVILCGRLTAKPELRYTGSNKPYTRFTIAVNRPTLNQNGEREADFINCISWGKQGEVISKYFDKGSQILISGRIQTTSFNDKDGNKRTSTDIVVEEFKFLEAKKQENVSNKKQDTDKQEDPFETFSNEIDNYLE